MHEMSLVEAVLESLEEMQKNNNWKRINKVTLNIGKMRQVIPEVMEFAYKTATNGTILEGSQLEIRSLEMKFVCSSCFREWGEDEMSFVCPFCSSTEVRMVQGMELEINTLEVEENV